MKFFMTLIALMMTFIVQSYASELVSVDALIKQGFQVKMGELTGAGSKVPLKNMQGLILPEGVLLKTDCAGIVVKTSIDPKVSDIVSIKTGDAEIPADEFIGIVTR